MSTSKNQTTSTTNCATNSTTDAFSSCGPLLYYHPDTHELIEVPDDELERESQYLCGIMQKKRELQFKIDELNDKYSLQAREKNPDNYQQELLQLYKNYDIASEELNQIVKDLDKIAEDAQGQEIPITSLEAHSKGFNHSVLELIQLTKGGEFKYSYIRSEKLNEKHVVHKLGTDDLKSETSKLIATENIKNAETGEEVTVKKIDTQELKKQLSEIAPTLKYQFFELEDKNYGIFENFEDDDNWVGGLHRWAEKMNKSLDSTPPYRGKYASFDKKAQLMRFTYGGSGDFELTKGNIGEASNPKASAKVSLYANLALAEGKTEGRIHLPCRQGIQIRYPKKNSDQLALLGALRFDLKLTLSGHVGASVGLQSSVNISQDGILGIPSQTSVDEPKNLNEVKGIDIASKAEELGAVSQGDIFLGLKVGGGLSGAILWLNPENKNDDDDGFDILGEITANIDVLVGAGASGTLAFTYYNGKIIATAKAGLCWGAGAKGSTSFEIDTKNIMSKFMPCFGYMLRNMDYEKLITMIEPEHFYAICSLPLLVGMELTNIALRETQQVMDELFYSWENKNNRVTLMETIVNSQGEFLKYCPPETKGAAIAALLEHTFWDDYFSPASHVQASGEAMATFSQRKRAILHTLRWAQSQRDFDNILQHASLIPSGSKENISANKARILAFLSQGEDVVLIPNHRLSKKVGPAISISSIKPSNYAAIFNQLEKKLPDSGLAKTNINEPYQEFIFASDIESKSVIYSPR